MKIYEIINEDIEEGIQPHTLTIYNTKKILTSMGFTPRRQKGSHEIWKDDTTGDTFPIPIHGKELSYGVTKQLNRMMRERGFNLDEMFMTIEEQTN